MNLVDSCGWLEYFADGPNAGFFAPTIEAPEQLLVPTLCVLEVFKSLCRQRDENAALKAAAIMAQGLSADLDQATALAAARLGAELKLPLANSVILATARRFGAVLWTQDADFKGMTGVKYTPKR
ncbi:MAG: type II toxin-antitoxin system VapC family toxin [Planctomycetota bacterium]